MENVETSNESEIKIKRIKIDESLEVIDLSLYSLEDSIIIENYSNLKEIIVNELLVVGNAFATKEVILKNLVKLEKIVFNFCRLKKLTIKDCENLKEISVQYNQSLSTLDLSMCKKLESVELSYNQLTSLRLPTENKIEKLYLNANKLINFDYSILNSNTLTVLENFRNGLKGNLSDFSHLINLKILCIDSNNIGGSFKSLCNLKELETICFYNNPIIPSLEWLNVSTSFLNILYDNMEWHHNDVILKSLTNLYPNEVGRNDEGEEIMVINKEFREKMSELRLLDELELIKRNLDLVMTMNTSEEEITAENRNVMGLSPSTVKSIPRSKTIRKDLLYNVLFNPNCCFLYWIEEEISLLKKYKINFYWKHAMKEETSEEYVEQFQQFFTSNY